VIDAWGYLWCSGYPALNEELYVAIEIAESVLRAKKRALQRGGKIDQKRDASAVPPGVVLATPYKFETSALLEQRYVADGTCAPSARTCCSRCSAALWSLSRSGKRAAQ